MDGTTLVGWILATVGFAGIYGAFKNETWLSVMVRTINPSTDPRRLNEHAPDERTP